MFGPERPKTLYKTTIVIWSKYDPYGGSLRDLAYEAEAGDAYCSSSKTVAVTDIDHDPDWVDTEFFGIVDEEEAADDIDITKTRDEWYVTASALDFLPNEAGSTELAFRIRMAVTQGTPNQDDEDLDEVITLVLTMREAALVQLTDSDD